MSKIELKKKRIHLEMVQFCWLLPRGNISITKGMNSKVKIEQCTLSKPQTKPNSKQEKTVSHLIEGDEGEENATPMFCIGMELIKKSEMI